MPGQLEELGAACIHLHRDDVGRARKAFPQPVQALRLDVQRHHEFAVQQMLGEVSRTAPNLKHPLA
jgi:hypothetical protein